MQVLLIGMDPETAETVLLSLRLRWPDAHPVITTKTQTGLTLLEQEPPDMLVLQSNSEESSLSKTIKEIRGFSDVPLVVLAEKGDEKEEISALELGADDYVRAPYSVGGLLARLLAVHRRCQAGGFPQSFEPPIQCGTLIINPATYEVSLEGRPIALTATEHRVLYLLVRNKGGVVTHRMIAQPIWGDRVDSRPLLKKYIQRIRRKLGDTSQNPIWIANVQGVGYKFIGPLVPIESAERPSSSSNGHRYAPNHTQSKTGSTGSVLRQRSNANVSLPV